MALKILGERILVKVNEIKDKEQSGIVIPNMAADKPNEARVIAIGDGFNVSVDINVGDEIIFERYSDIEIDIDGDRFAIIKYEDILMIK